MFLVNYKSEEHVRNELLEYWEAKKSEVDKYEFIVAAITEPDYEESAYFLLRDKLTGQLFEATGGH